MTAMTAMSGSLSTRARPAKAASSRPTSSCARYFVFSTREDGRPDYVSPEFFAYVGLPPAASTEEILARVHPDDVARLVPRGADLRPGVAFEADIRIRTRGADYKWFRLRAELVEDALGRRWQGYAINNGRRLRAARHADDASDDLRRADAIGVAESLITAEEHERHRIAIELHDSTSQHLVAIGFGLSQLRRLIGGGRGAEGVLEEMASSLREAVNEIRVLTYTMMPTGLERDGLDDTTRRFVRGFASRTGIQATFHADSAVNRGNAATQHTAYRIVQEALLNVHRHAQATSAHVEFLDREGWLMVRVTDDGKGIDGLETFAPGVGIASMRSRAAQLGGALEISCPDGGTVVSASLPVFEN